MKNKNIINGIYFDEISNKVDSLLLPYFELDAVDLIIKKSDTGLTFTIKYLGNMENRFVTNPCFILSEVNYVWYVSVDGVPYGEVVGNQIYRSVSISVKKSFLFNKRKVLVQSNVTGERMVFHAKKVTLDRVIISIGNDKH